VKIITLTVVALISAVGVPSTSYATSHPHTTDRPFRVYLPTWLPPKFHRVSDPMRTIYWQDADTHVMRRYGANEQWVEVYEDSAGCCLDTVSDHLVGLTKLGKGRVGYFSDQGQQFGGFYLFWDQGHTYICLNSPNLPKSVLVRVAESMSATGFRHP
jgi:hypothetical protein